MPFAVVMSGIGTATADPTPFMTRPDAFFIGRAGIDPYLVGAFGGGPGMLGRSPGGLFLGVETGWARWLDTGAVAARPVIAGDQAPNNGWAFGARVGYQWRSGLALQLRFDDLGVHAALDAGSLLVVSGGVRYSLPFAIMPFAEALVGAMIGGASDSPAAGLGVGLSVPIARHAIIDLAIRDWIAEVDGVVRHIPTVLVGVELGFGR